MTKYATRLKFFSTGTSAAVLTVGAAAPACRNLAKVISDGASNPKAIKVGDTGIVFIVEEKGTENWEESKYTITSATQITRTEVLSSSAGGTTPATFSGGALTVYNTSAGDSETNTLTAADSVEATALPVANAVADADGLFMLQGGVVKILPASVHKAYVGVGTGGSTTPTVTGVTVSPSTATVAGGGTQTFTATVAGTNNPAQTVTWTASAGTITAGGVLTAPAATGSTQTITVTATSTVDNTKSGTATVTVAAAGSTVSGVTVSPSTANVAGGATQQFTATVAGTNSPAQTVTWAASAGSINASGLFTAPAAISSAQTITITATSTQDTSKAGTATVTVAAGTATMADTYRLTANNSNGANMPGELTYPLVASGGDYYAGGNPYTNSGGQNVAGLIVRVNIRDAAGNAFLQVPKFVWGINGEPCPAEYTDTALAIGDNGCTAGHANGMVTGSRLGGWGDTSTTSSQWGTFQTGATLYPWVGPSKLVNGTVTMVLWVLFPDGSKKMLDNNLGQSNPIKYYFTTNPV